MEHVQEDYVSEQTGKLLYEKGFSQITDTKWPECPTQALIIKWLRVKYNIYIDVLPIKISTSSADGYRYGWGIMQLVETLMKGYEYTEPLGYSSFEEANEAAILYCLNHLI